MSNKTRNILKAVAVILVLLTLLMHFSVIIIPAISVYKYWIVVASFVLLLVSSK
ncbi:MAG TPA: hypothetical protein VL443_24980 [Cyclobacteriaceae bacterium]|jgi:hypothetical protein|nr:hypothetical protein [Cyclobacteriaceae bacterium]